MWGILNFKFEFGRKKAIFQRFHSENPKNFLYKPLPSSVLELEFSGMGRKFSKKNINNNNTVSFLFVVEEQRDFGSGKIEGFSEE